MEGIVVDTHVLIWDQLDPGRLSARARTRIRKADEAGQIIVCEISLWEIASLMRKKRLVLDLPCPDFIKDVLRSRSYILQGITPQIADLANRIQLATGDPADHLIAATAVALRMPLITADTRIRQCTEVDTCW